MNKETQAQNTKAQDTKVMAKDITPELKAAVYSALAAGHIRRYFDKYCPGTDVGNLLLQAVGEPGTMETTQLLDGKQPFEMKLITAPSLVYPGMISFRIQDNRGPVEMLANDCFLIIMNNAYSCLIFVPSDDVTEEMFKDFKVLDIKTKQQKRNLPVEEAGDNTAMYSNVMIMVREDAGNGKFKNDRRDELLKHINTKVREALKI